MHQDARTMSYWLAMKP